MFINGKTEIFALVGNNISHSLSPKIHNFLFGYFKLNSVYIPLELAKDLKNLFQFFKNCNNFIGFNVTIPYKEEAYKLADIVSENGEKIKSVNTLFKDKKNLITADNTDIFGFRKSLAEDLHFDSKGKNVVILGSGGTAKTVAIALAEEADNITMISRNKGNIALLLKKYKNVKWQKFENIPEKLFFPETDLIVNATPLGLNGEVLNIDYNILKRDCSFFDVLYISSPLIKIATDYKFNAVNGLNMLIYQAIKSFELWTNFEINAKLILQLKKEVFA